MAFSGGMSVPGVVGGGVDSGAGEEREVEDSPDVGG